MDFPSATSPTGGIVATTTERGLPLALRLAASELEKAPQVLADEILAVCRLAAVRSQVSRRRALLAADVDPAVVRNLRLANEDDLVAAQNRVSGDEDTEPAGWLRPV